jgi:hypothetical protein
VEFGVEIGECRGGFGSRGGSSSPPPGAAHPPCVAAYYSKDPFESIAERKFRRRQSIEDGNEEISGRDLRWVPLPGFGAIVGKYIPRSMAPWRILSILEADPITLGSQEENLCSCGRCGSLQSS